MRKLTVLSLFLFLAVSVQSLPLKILSATPRGTLAESGRQAVTVTFNQPVTALAEASAFSSADCPLVITPAVSGSCRFVGTQTLLFEPAQPWPSATLFTAKINRGFTSRVSGARLTSPYEFSFTTPRPQVRQVYPQNNEHWISLTPTLYVGFSLPIAANTAARFAYLTNPSGEQVALSARELTPQEYEQYFFYLPNASHAVAFTPVRPLDRATPYTLVLKAGFPTTSGNLGLAKEYHSTFVTYPPLHVQGIQNNGCLPFMPQVRFSAPVRMRDLVAAIRVAGGSINKLSVRELDTLGQEVIIPPFAKLSDTAKRSWLDKYTLTSAEQTNGAAFFATPLSFLELQPEQPLTVTISKDLTDIYGDRLEKDYTFTVTNNGYCPAADFTGGYGVLESYLPARLPIDVINMPGAPVQAARFNKENYIPFLTSNDNAYCAEKPLTQTTFSGEYTFTDIKDKTVKTYLDLNRFSPTAQDSLVFSQIKLTRHGEDCWVSSTSNLTDVGLTFKVSPENILLWATSLETAEPMANLTVELRDRTNTILWSGSTDMNGLARAPGWNQLDTQLPSWGGPKLYAFVSSAGGDGFVSTELDDGLEPWRFNVSYTYNPQQETQRTFLFTERGIYRPGETVYLKGIMREWKNNAWHIPSQLQGKVVVSDAVGSEVIKRTVTASGSQGTFDLSFEVPSSAHSGDWEVVFTPQRSGEKDPDATYTSFKVDTAKAAEFKLTLQPDKTDYVSGDEARFTLAANYQFGSPLSQAPVAWTLRREMAWFEPEGFNEYNFVPYFIRENEYKENGKLLASSSALTDEKGRSSFVSRLPEVEGPVRVFAQAGVQSPSKQDLFARKDALLHPASFYIGAKTPEGFARAGSPVAIEVVAVSTDGKRVEAPSVTAQLRQVEWHSVRKVGLSGRLEWVSSKEEIELPSQTLDISQNGSTFTFVPEQSGNYQILFLTKDASGRPVKGGMEIMVYGKDGPAWAQKDDDILALKQDKNTYLPGQTARISVPSPYDTAQALVTVEREGVLDAWVTSVKGGADYIDIPIKENYLPNVFVSVTLIKGRTAAPVNAKGVDLGKPQSKTGYVELKIEPAAKKIDVSVSATKKSYRPGDEVTLKLTTQLARKGVPAEVVVWVADEGVLALTDYKTPDPFSAFYNTRPLSVFTSANRSYVIGQRNFGEKGENRGGGGSALAKLGGVDLRSHFSFVPLYQARVQTDKKGRAEVKFKLPDNLTRFRVMALAVRTQEFGVGQTQFTVSKPLMISAAVPTLARKGDVFSCQAVVYNYADKKGNLTVRAIANGAIKLTGPDTQEISVPLGGAQEVSWPCQATQIGSAQVAFSVKGRGESDGVQTQVTVAPVEKMQTLALSNATQQAQTEVVAKPASVSPFADNRVAFALSSTALLNLKGAIAYLMAYPYDCLEQQLSKIRPVLVSAQLVQDFKLGDITQVKKQAQEVLNRLPDYQTSAGGLGYWPHRLPDPYVTAYALETAYLAKQAGFIVPEQTLKKAADWLEKAFAADTTQAFIYALPEVQTARAQSVYALALYGREISAAFNNLYTQRTGLPLPAVAYLLKAAVVSGRGEDIRHALAQEILNHISYTPTTVYFTSSDMPWLHGSAVVTTALSLEALLQSNEPFGQAARAVTWLLTQRNAQGHWNNTVENAAVLSALNTYEKTVESQTPDFTAQVSLGDTTALTAQFQGRSTEEKTTSLPFSTVYNNGNETRVTFAKNGPGMLYYTLTQTYLPEEYTTPVNAGFEVSRRITAEDGTEVQTLQAGKRYYVTLTVNTASARHFVVAEDFIPAGVEAVNTDLATSQMPVSDGPLAADSPFGRLARYEGRVAAFADYLPAGTHTFTYMINAMTDGTFAYPSAWVSLMYEPAVFGRNATSQIVIEK